MSNKAKRGKVWLAVGGLVKSSQGHWLVVKKRYGGLKGKWSLPAGFVDEGETADEAVVREVKEETGIDCVVKGLIGLRTGVISEEISDNMLVFLLEPLDEGKSNIRKMNCMRQGLLHLKNSFRKKRLRLCCIILSNKVSHLPSLDMMG